MALKDLQTYVNMAMRCLGEMENQKDYIQPHI